jgi:hypothetical protein
MTELEGQRFAKKGRDVCVAVAPYVEHMGLELLFIASRILYRKSPNYQRVGTIILFYQNINTK